MTTPDQHTYDLTVTWNEGRIGTMSSDKLDDSIKVATPPEFPGGVDGIWSPEHLFVASVSSCFMTSFAAVADYSKLDFTDLRIDSIGTMSKENGKFVMSKILLKPVLTIEDESKEKKAYRLLEKAEEICLITRSIKAEVVCEPDVKVSVQA